MQSKVGHGGINGRFPKLKMVFGFALFVLASAVGAQPTKPYVSADGKYSIKFPGVPKVTEKTEKNATGELTVHIATYALADGSTYMVSYTDLANTVDAKNHAPFFEAIRTDVKGTSGRLIGDTKELTIGEAKWPGREFTVEKNQQRIRLRVVLRENRLYQVVVIGTATFVTGKDASAFVESLELTK
jgi:hypothetical protein